MTHHRQESVEHRRGPPLEERLVANIEQLVDRLARVVDRHRLGRDGEEPCVQVLQQDDVDRTDELRRPVLALHQLLARGLRRCVGEPELARKRILLVEHEAVLAPARQVVQPHAQPADQPLLA